jgi:hypothetical protein
MGKYNILILKSLIVQETMLSDIELTMEKEQKPLLYAFTWLNPK